MKIVVFGGSGHEVVSITRSGGTGYHDAPEWQEVVHVTADCEQEDADGTFGQTVLAQDPDVVIDLVCFTVESAAALVEALRGTVDHLVHCGSIWRHGASRKLPITEDSDSAGAPFDLYGIQKAAIARMLKDESASPRAAGACPRGTRSRRRGRRR